MKILSTQIVYFIIQSILLPGVFVLSISGQNKTFPQEHTSYSDHNMTEFYSMTGSTSLEETTEPDFNNQYISKQIVVSDNDSSLVTGLTKKQSSKFSTKRFNLLLFHVLGNNSQNFNSSHLNNSSNDISSVVLKNIAYYDLCDVLHLKEGCMQSSVVRDLQNALDTNVTDLTSTTIHLNDVKNCSDETCILTQNFHCDIDEDGEFRISCVNVVDIYSIGKYLPNDTIVLDISYSYQEKLLKPLIPHLKSLKSLALTNNHHRFITKAFMGLVNLEKLDLSNNDILALIGKTFLAIPKLNVLNLSRNRLTRIEIVSNAVNSLKNLKNLTLDHNTFKFIVKADLSSLVNCKIEVLSLFNTTINSVERGAFHFLPNLKILDLSINYVNEFALTNLTCSITNTIEILFFRLMLEIQSFPYEALYCLTNTKLKELYLGNNYIRIIPGFPSMPNLRLLSLSNGTVESIARNAFENLTNLESLYLSHNKLKYFPEALSSIKSLKKLYLDSQDTGPEYARFVIKNYTFQHLVNLETIGLSRLSLGILPRHCLYGLKNLNFTSLPLAELFLIQDFAFETHKSVTTLDLRGNSLSFLSNFTFYGLENLKYLLLTSNKISFMAYPFQYSPLLRMIFLQSNVLITIPKGLFSNLENLNVLSLEENKIIPWQERIFHPNASVRHLDLSKNNIDYISDCMLSEFHQVEKTLDLSKNPFNCSKCGMKEFQIFFKNSNISSKMWQREKRDSMYVCVNPESMRNGSFFEIDISDDLCLDIESEVLSLITIIIICLLIISIIFILSLCYLFRWYVRYGIFHFKTSLGNNKITHRNKTYQYDAFIIYSSTDAAWVDDYLMPTLEGQEPSYKLCNHQRDFRAGNRITKNILEAIDNSHKVMIIFTEDFIKSAWCMYELHIAQHKLFGDTRDILILIKLGAIDKRLYSKHTSYIEKTRKCFTWSNNPMGQKLFWEQIRKELGPSKARQNLIAI